MWRRILFAVLLAGLSVCSPSYAAGGWPVPASGGITLGYGGTYLRDGSQAVHRGIDIAAPAGSPVRSAQEGEVSFAGLVPGGSGQVYAVSVRTSQGLTVTCMPLECASVAAGDEIAAGDELGVLAANGDVSSPASHVHLSVRREQAYLDPMLVLGAREVPQPSPEAPVEVPAPVTVPETPAPLGVASAVTGMATRAALPTAVPQASADAVASSAEPASGIRGAEAPAIDGPVPHDVSVGRLTADPRGEFSLPITRNAIDSTPRAARSVNAPARVLSRLTNAPDARRSLLVVLGGCLAAAAGLWPLWRHDPRTRFTGGVRPTLDNVAAVVGR